jgi:Protein of unknown function (DUF3489)
MTNQKTYAPKLAENTELVKQQSKRAQIITLLERPSGATLADMTALTGWLPHTARAALTGLRKAGHMIAGEKSEGILHCSNEAYPAVKL